MTKDAMHEQLTEKIIRCFFDVYNQLHFGFLEKVYENALKLELKAQGLKVESQKRIEVLYKGSVVGEYFADLVVNDLVIIEIKAAENLCDEHALQLLNYLRATKIEVGLLLNFGKKPQLARRVFTNTQKSLEHE
ncbi:MAG TPA: GxxExxY protein [Candidatus Cloacimonadota bacterium]|nr:GxxExxY protein [Candidatus Cloacimonadota bacterium]